MRNRAKCKLCSVIIESFHETDYVDCSCGEISIHGGKYKLGCAAKNWANFMRVDDLGNEIVVKIDGDENAYKTPDKGSKKDLIVLLDDLIQEIEKLPSHAMTASVTHYDLLSVLFLLSSLFKAKDE